MLKNINTIWYYFSSAEVIRLGFGIAPDNIGLIILEFPGADNYQVAHTYPHAFFKLARYSTHS